MVTYLKASLLLIVMILTLHTSAQPTKKVLKMDYTMAVKGDHKKGWARRIEVKASQDKMVSKTIMERNKRVVAPSFVFKDFGTNAMLYSTSLKREVVQ